MPRDAKGRFLPRLGAPLTPGGDAVTVVPATPPAPPDDEWGFNIASLGLVVDLSAEHIVDSMRRQAITDIRAAILEGRRPDGRGAQKALGAKALATPGRQSSFRGYRTGRLADSIKATRITGDTSKAKCRIVPPSDRNVYVAQELARGVALLTADGAIGEGMRRAASRTVEAMLTGREVLTEPAEVEADDV